MEQHTLARAETRLELRILEGPQAGARAALAEQTPCLLAAEPDGDGADIVLREDPAAARVRITACGGEALLEVLQGQVQHGERTLTSGEQLRWTMHVPLQIGRSLIAFGEASDEHWPRVAPADNAPSDAPAPAALPEAPSDTVARRRAPWLMPLGIVVALASAGAWGLAHVASAPHVEAAPPPPLAVALKSSEFATLSVSNDASGRIALRGRLATLAERTRLDAWLAVREFTPSVDVRVDEGLVRDVTDVFRVNGVAVQARVQASGDVAAEAAEPDAQRLARAEEVVRRDVRGLDKLSVVNRAAPPPPPPPPPVVDDPGKRIASLVPGEPAYLVTADGARYFVGALLPSGHRITRIAEQRVTLERDGRPSTLNF